MHLCILFNTPTWGCFSFIAVAAMNITTRHKSEVSLIITIIIVRTECFCLVVV